MALRRSPPTTDCAASPVGPPNAIAAAVVPIGTVAIAAAVICVGPVAIAVVAVPASDADAIHAIPTQAASFTDLRDHAVRLVQRRAWHGLRRHRKRQNKRSSGN